MQFFFFFFFWGGGGGVVGDECHWRELPQVSFLSRQKFCRDKHVFDHGFESPQERRENYFLQGQLSVLILISVSVPPSCYRIST